MPRRAPAALAATLLLVAAPARADKVDELNQALLSDPSYKVKVQAALVLGKLNDKRAVPALLEALRDENETVRGMAVLSLGKLGDARAVDALHRLESDASPFVRGNVQKALANFAGTAAPSTAPPSSGARHFVAVKISGGGGPPEAQRVLSDAMVAELGKLPRVTTSVGGPPTAALLAARKLDGWVLEGNLKLKVSGAGASAQLDCDVSANIVTLGNRSIKATSSAGASIPGVRSASDASAQRQCLEAVAQGLADDMGKFLSRQP
jgi:hypothetical protein